MMPPRLFVGSAIVAVLAPLLIPAATYYAHPRLLLAELITCAMMAAPQLLLVAFGALFAFARRSAWLSPLLIVLTLSLMSFQALVWWAPGFWLAYYWYSYYALAWAVALLAVLGAISMRWLRSDQTSDIA